MMPAVLIGSFIGIIFNEILPDIWCQIVLALVLFFLTFQAGIKAKQLYLKENKALIAKSESNFSIKDKSLKLKLRSSSKLDKSIKLKTKLANLRNRNDNLAIQT